VALCWKTGTWDERIPCWSFGQLCLPTSRSSIRIVACKQPFKPADNRMSVLYWAPENARYRLDVIGVTFYP
jgi:hypothetical protein